MLCQSYNKILNARVTFVTSHLFLITPPIGAILWAMLRFLVDNSRLVPPAAMAGLSASVKV